MTNKSSLAESSSEESKTTPSSSEMAFGSRIARLALNHFGHLSEGERIEAVITSSVDEHKEKWSDYKGRKKDTEEGAPFFSVAGVSDETIGAFIGGVSALVDEAQSENPSVKNIAYGLADLTGSVASLTPIGPAVNAGFAIMKILWDLFEPSPNLRGAMKDSGFFPDYESVPLTRDEENLFRVSFESMTGQKRNDGLYLDDVLRDGRYFRARDSSSGFSAFRRLSQSGLKGDHLDAARQLQRLRASAIVACATASLPSALTGQKILLHDKVVVSDLTKVEWCRYLGLAVSARDGDALRSVITSGQPRWMIDEIIRPLDDLFAASNGLWVSEYSAFRASDRQKGKLPSETKASFLAAGRWRDLDDTPLLGFQPVKRDGSGYLSGFSSYLEAMFYPIKAIMKGVYGFSPDAAAAVSGFRAIDHDELSSNMDVSLLNGSMVDNAIALMLALNVVNNPIPRYFSGEGYGIWEGRDVHLTVAAINRVRKHYGKELLNA